MSKYKGVFEQKNQVLDSSKSGITESVKDGITESVKDEKVVNLGIKIPAWQRNYWVGKAKSQGKTISSIIIESLSEKLGNPN